MWSKILDQPGFREGGATQCNSTKIKYINQNYKIWLGGFYNKKLLHDV